MKGFALSSSCPAVPITPATATACLQQLRRTEALYADYLVNPESREGIDSETMIGLSENADMWERRPWVDFLYTTTLGEVTDLPDYCRVEIVPDFSAPSFPRNLPSNIIAYHTEDAMGRPVCYISFAMAGNDWPSAASHEIAEARIDGPTSGTMPPSHEQTKRRAKEVCDPVQGTDYAEAGVMVSNVVGPSYWGLDETSPLCISGTFDFTAGQIMPQGYQSFADGSQIYGERVTEEKKALVEARGPRERKVRVQ